MRIFRRHPCLNALAALLLALTLPVLQGSGLQLHLHLGEAGHEHGPHLHLVHDPGHTHEHHEVDLTPQVVGKSASLPDFALLALPALPFGELALDARHPPPFQALSPPFRSPPAWLAPPLRAPPA